MASSSLTVTGVGPRGPRGPGLLAGRGEPWTQTNLNPRHGDTYLDLSSGKVYGLWTKANGWPTTPVLFLSQEPDDVGLSEESVVNLINTALQGHITTQQVQSIVQDALANHLSSEEITELIQDAVGSIPQNDPVTRFTGVGPPGTIIGASPGDHYLDVTTGDIYVLS